MPTGEQTIVTEIVGIVAGVLTAASGIPQVISIFKNNNDAISRPFLYILFVGATLWLVYALLLNIWRNEDDSPFTAVSLIVFQAVTLLFLTMILVKLSIIKI